MTGGAGGPVFEIASGQIALGMKERFVALHWEVLRPMMKRAGISPALLLITDIGRYQRFLNVYRYDSWDEYERITRELLGDPGLQDFYREIAECMAGGISIELASEVHDVAAW